MTPKVSVIVSVYESEKYFRKCIESFISQTYKNLEIICINDCSPENEATIIFEYKANDERIVYHRNESNVGAGYSKNKGLEISSGEYVLFVDSDDYIARDLVERLVEEAEKIEADYVGYDLVRISSDGTLYPLKKFQSYEERFFQSMSACIKLYRKDFLINHDIKFSNLRSAEDMIMAFKVFALARCSSWLDLSGYFYVQREYSLTNPISIEKDAQVFLDIFMALREIEAFLKIISNDNKYAFLQSKYEQVKMLYLKYHLKIRHKNHQEAYMRHCENFLERSEYNVIQDEWNKIKKLEQFASCLSDKIRRYSCSKLILFGCNDLATYVIQQHQNSIHAVVDSKKFGQTILGRVVCKFEEIEEKDDMLFVITAINLQYIIEISEEIRGKFPKACVVHI